MGNGYFENVKNKFIIGDWVVFYRSKGNSKWKKFKGEKGYWYADPMLFTYKNELLLFTEAFQKKCQIGRLAVSKMVNGEFSKPQIIIKKPYHMSYPCTFIYKDSVYMIPETSQNHSLELFKATNDKLDNWEKVGILDSNIICVDSTVFVDKEDVFLLTYFQENKKYTTRVYKLDMDQMKISEIFSNQINEDIARPAGKIYREDNNYYRPVQYNVNCYGEEMCMLEINPLDNEWMGNAIDSITTKSIGLEHYGLRTHTYNTESGIEVVDVLHEFTSLWAPCTKIRRKLHNLKYKIIFLGK